MKQDLRRYAVERILEDERLTADLIDHAAKILLDWGVARAESLPISSQTDVDAHLTNLKHAMKCINDWAGQAPPDAQREKVQALLEEINHEWGWNDT